MSLVVDEGCDLEIIAREQSADATALVGREMQHVIT